MQIDARRAREYRDLCLRQAELYERGRLGRELTALERREWSEWLRAEARRVNGVLETLS